MYQHCSFFFFFFSLIKNSWECLNIRYCIFWKNLNNHGIKGVTNSSKVTKNCIIIKNNNIDIKSTACGEASQYLDCCKKIRDGKISRDPQRWIYEHRRDLKKGNINNDSARNNLETNQNFNFKDSKLLVHIPNKQGSKTAESSII